MVHSRTLLLAESGRGCDTVYFRGEGKEKKEADLRYVLNEISDVRKNLSSTPEQTPTVNWGLIWFAPSTALTTRSRCAIAEEYSSCRTRSPAGSCFRATLLSNHDPVSLSGRLGS